MSAPYTTDTHTPAPHTPTPTYLYDLLTPHLLHQLSTLTAVQALLTPLPPTAPTPLSTLHTLHRILADSPKLLALIPHVPQARPLRAPTISYVDPTEPHPPPMPCPLSFPFGDLEGVAAAPSTLSTPDSDAGLGLFGIRPKKSSYTRLQRYSHLFARKGDFICSYHGPIRTITELVRQPTINVPLL